MITLFLPQRLRKRLERNPPVIWLINLAFLLVALFVVHIVLYRWMEQATWEESLWVTWATFSTVGYGDFSAKSTLGRFGSVLFGTVGIAVLGTLFAAVFETIQHMKDKRRTGYMDNPNKNGYVLFHFPGEAALHLFLRELYAVEGEVAVCIVDEAIEQLPASIIQEFGRRVHFVRGSSLDRSTYERANVARNKTVIVFPKDPLSRESDGITNTVVKLILSFVDETTRVLYVLVDESNAWMFDSRATAISQDLEIFAMVQECQDPGAAVMVTRLLLNTEGANPHSVAPVKTAGLTWREFQLKVAEKGLKLNPLALIHDGIPDSCPDPDRKIQNGDRMIIAADTEFDWQKVEDQIMQADKS